MGIKIKDMPATLFVKIEKDDNADWLNAVRHVEDHAEIGTRTKVGVYKLHQVKTVEGVVQSEVAKRR